MEQSKMEDFVANAALLAAHLTEQCNRAAAAQEVAAATEQTAASTQEVSASAHQQPWWRTDEGIYFEPEAAGAESGAHSSAHDEL